MFWSRKPPTDVAEVQARLDAVLDSYVAKLGVGGYRVIAPSGTYTIVRSRQEGRDLILNEAIHG